MSGGREAESGLAFRQFFDLSRGDFVDALADYESIPAQLGEPTAAFLNNLRSVTITASLPFLMVRGSVIRERFRRLQTAEAIRTLKDSPGEPDYALATARANDSFSAWFAEPYNQSATADDIGSELEYLFEHTPEICSASQELLRQALVMTWGSLEVFMSDYIRNVMNSSASEALRLLNHEKTRRHFGGKSSVSLDVLAAHGFNLSSKMGDAILQNHRLDNLGTMSDAVCVLFPGQEATQRALKANSLRLLNQRRHLIVHRRSIVDSVFLEATGLRLEVGAELSVKTDDLLDGLRAVHAVADAILQATCASPKRASSNDEPG